MALIREIERLKSLPVFAAFNEEALRLMAFSAETRRVPAGLVLFRRGEPAEGAVLVAAGLLAIDTEDEEEPSVRWALAGTLLNETALFAPGPQVATAVAQEESTVVTLPRSLMMRVLGLYPQNAPALRRYRAARLGERLAAFRAATSP